MATDPRYAPPRTTFAIEANRPAPLGVRIAVAILSLSLACSIPNVSLGSIRETSLPMIASNVAGIASFYGLYVFFIFKVYQGKHWARIITLMFTIFAGLTWVAPERVNGIYGSTEWVLNITSLVLDTFALLILFTKPANTWFKTNLKENGENSQN